MSVQDVVMDFAFASLLIFIGQMMRAKIRMIQRSFMPAGMIGGFLGLFLGGQFLNIVPFSAEIGSYAWLLVVLIFASVGIAGIKINKAEGERIGSYFFYRFAVFFLQFCIPIIFVILVVSKLDTRINYGFGLLLASGFLGGHGTAAAVGGTFAKLGFPEATDLAMTFATAGILTGIFGGLLFIKWATKKGYTSYIKDFGSISDDFRTGMVEPGRRTVFGEETVSSISIDPLCWHLAFLMIPTGAALLICGWIDSTFGIALPEFTISFLLAIVLSFGLKPTGLDRYLDLRITDRIAGTATDFVVFFGIASIKIAVIIEYAVPLLLTLLCGILIVFLTVRYFGARMNNWDWFERAIFVYGYSTGVFAIGMILLRIVDPQNKSKTLADVAVAEPPNSIAELILWSTGPYMLLNGQHWTFALINLGLVLLCCLISWKCHWWYKTPLSGRPSVADIEEKGS